MNEHTLIDYGTIIAYSKGSQDMVIVSNGIFQVMAYVPRHVPQPQIGHSYTLIKVNNTYHLGSEIELI
jgi:hypothetical protein